MATIVKSSKFNYLIACLGFAIVSLFALIGSSDDAFAMACPRPCWAELHCCCITPCPVTDAKHAQVLTDILKNIKQANKLYGVQMPGMDSDSSLKSPVSAASLKSAGLNALQQGVRNVLRGASTKEGIKANVPVFKQTLADEDGGMSLPPVHSDKPSGSGELTPIESKASELDKAFWSTQVLSGNDTQKLKDLRYNGARVEAVDALAFAYLKRAEIAKSASQSDALVKRLEDSLTLSDEIKLNAEAKALLTSDYSRFQEMMSYVVAERASTFVAAKDLEVTKEARVSSNSSTPVAGNDSTDSYKFAQARSACSIATNNALDEHDKLQNINNLESYLPGLMSTVNEQQARNNHSWMSEGSIVSLLSQLYQDPGYAWRQLSSDLSSADRTSYADQSRYSSAKAISNAAVTELFAQKASTRYGQRIATPGCTPALQQLNACLPFTSAGVGGSYLAPIGTINSYYSSGDLVYDAYNRYGGIDTSALSKSAVALPPLPQSTGSFNLGGKNGVGDDYGSALGARADALAENLQTSEQQASVMLQYRQEAMKRKLYWDAIRRGDGSDFGPTMNPALKSELVSDAPQCFAGPLTTNSQNLSSLFNWFDLAPTCSHRTWDTGAYAGQTIDHSYLGGTDSSIWAIENDIDDYNQKHTGRSGVVSAANAAQKLCSAAAAAAPGVGRSDLMPELNGYLSTISAILQDTRNVNDITLKTGSN